MTKVASLFGGEIPAPGEPNELLVDRLEKLLAAAKAGEIVGACIAMLHSDRGASYTNVGLLGGYSLLGAVTMAKRDLENFIQELDE